MPSKKDNLPVSVDVDLDNGGTIKYANEVIAIIAGFTYYTSVAQDQPFKRRFWEMALISVGVAVVSFVVGILAKKFLGVDL